MTILNNLNNINNIRISLSSFSKINKLESIIDYDCQSQKCFDCSNKLKFNNKKIININNFELEINNKKINYLTYYTNPFQVVRTHKMT